VPTTDQQSNRRLEKNAFDIMQSADGKAKQVIQMMYYKR